MSVAQRLYFPELANPGLAPATPLPAARNPQPVIDPQPAIDPQAVIDPQASARDPQAAPIPLDPLEFGAVVTDIRENSRVEARQLWQLALDRTAFYPTGGGQPHDLGRLEAVARSGTRLEVPVLRVEEDDSGEIWHFVEKPLAAGTRITGYIDPARRLDHRQQHTGQHLLSAIFLRELGAPTLSFHLGANVSTIDLAIDTLPEAALEHVETATNRAIASDLPVRARWIDPAEAQAMLGRGELRKLPERSGPIRLVEIQGIESNACGGTHVEATGQISGLTLRRVERVRGGLRVEFCCGFRAVRAARIDFNLLTESGKLLSVAPTEIPAKLTRFLDDAKAAAKERKSLLEELAAMEARLVLADAGSPTGPGFMELLLVERDAVYAKLLAAKIVAVATATVVLIAATERDSATLILARGTDSTLDCAQTMRSAMAAIGARGGGSPDLAQGAIPTAALEDMVTALRSLAGF